MPGTAAVQVAERFARRGEIAVFERELRAAYEPRGLQRIAGTVGALEPPVAALEVAHLVRGARGEQRGDAGRRTVFECNAGLLFGARIAPFVVRLQRGCQRGMRPLAAPPAAPRAHGGGKRHRVAQEAQQQIQDKERDKRRDDEHHHRHLDPPRRIDEEDVSGVHAREQHERHGRGEHRDQPEQRSHPGVRVRRDLKPRTASRLSEIDGISKLMVAAESCLN